MDISHGDGIQGDTADSPSIRRAIFRGAHLTARLHAVCPVGMQKCGSQGAVSSQSALLFKYIYWKKYAFSRLRNLQPARCQETRWAFSLGLNKWSRGQKMQLGVSVFGWESGWLTLR